MKLIAPGIICCHGWGGVLCLMDWLNHAVLQGHFNQRVCDRHEHLIQDEHIIAVYWRA